MTEKQKEELYEKVINNEIKELKENDTFIIGCKQCGKCCRNREDILLNPLDVLHIAQSIQKPLDEVVEKYGIPYFGESSHLPLILLKYRKDSFGNGTTCYFLGKRDEKYYCRINDKKPYSCKTYPLERLAVFPTAEKTGNFSPIYHEQLHYKEYSCIGIQEAIKNNQTSTVLDWVGGKERKELADTFWKLNMKFQHDLYKTVNLEKFVQHEDQEDVEAIMNHFYILYYLDYDYKKSEGEFLKQFEINTNKILNMFRDVVKICPRYACKKK